MKIKEEKIPNQKFQQKKKKKSGAILFTKNIK